MTSDKAILDADHNVIPATLDRWGMWLEGDGRKARRVDETLIGDARISTVFIGLNHGTEDQPLWFETMIFGGKHDGWCDRYESWDEAVAGHANAIALVKGPTP